MTGTGPNNRIIKQDVLEHASNASKAQASTSTSPTSSAAEAPEWTDIELSQMRKVIAERLVLSKTTIPHFYIAADVEMDNILK